LRSNRPRQNHHRTKIQENGISKYCICHVASRRSLTAFKNPRAFVALAIALILLAVPQASFALAQPNSVTANACNYAYFKDHLEGAYAGPGGAFVEYDVSPELMFLTFCSSAGNLVDLGTPPTGAPPYGYASMGGISTKTLGTVLVLDVNDSNSSPGPGFWFCFGATSTGCAIVSTYITLPSGFCSAQPIGQCNPQGIALDGKLNVYYADPSNADVVKCTYASGYQSCSVIEALTNQPWGIFRASNGDIWVTDHSCSGNVWKNGVSQFTFSDQLEGITISSANPSKTPHVYFATTARCGFYSFAFIYDLTDHTITTPPGAPFSGPNDIPSITTKLQFTSGATGVLYMLKDTV
jgi:hypothetical protein